MGLGTVATPFDVTGDLLTDTRIVLLVPILTGEAGTVCRAAGRAAGRLGVKTAPLANYRKAAIAD